MSRERKGYNPKKGHLIAQRREERKEKTKACRIDIPGTDDYSILKALFEHSFCITC